MPKFQMKKRKQDDKGRDAAKKVCGETMGLFAVSDDSKVKMFNAAAVALGREDAVVERGVWRRAAKSLTDGIGKRVALPNVEEGLPPVCFFITSVAAVLQLVVKQSSGYAALLKETLVKNPGQCLSILLYSDEATAGNIVQVNTTKKVALWYFSILELGRLWCDTMWHPICLIQHQAYESIQGGVSATVKAVINAIDEEHLQHGFPVELDDGPHLLKLQMSFMLGDMDALRAGLDLKGSCGIRPCVFCKNVVKKDSLLSDINPLFVEMCTSEISKFQEQTDAEIFSVLDDLRESKRLLSVASFKRKCVCAGFNYNQHGVLQDSHLRTLLPPSRWLMDPMHLFWSNGVCSWEVVSMYQLWGETNVGDLVAFLSLPWTKAGPGSCTPYFRRSLGHESMFGGNSYKGSASNLQVFFPLFHYFLERTCAELDSMQLGLKSLRSLRRVVMELREQTHARVMCVDTLQALQVQHQIDCKNAWGSGFMRPKHHGRFHHAQQLARFQIQCDCFPMEKKHRFYKSFIGPGRFDSFAGESRNRKGEYSQFCMQQMLQHHVHSLKSANFDDRLVGKTWKDQELQNCLNDASVQCGKTMVYGGRTFTLQDFIIGGDFKGVVRKLCISRTRSFILLQVCENVSNDEFSSTWKLTEKRQVIPLSRIGRNPIWWLWLDDNKILALH